jgi:biotin carboxyl carrier protein
MANVDGTPLTSPMPGKIADYHKSDRSRVMAGETIITIESMKMEMPIMSPVKGIVTQLNF